MKYGYFDHQQREYVIERPDTPWPWINYLGEGEYCAIISNNAGGYSFHKTPGQNRLLRYRFNALPADRPGRYVYFRDEQGQFWSQSWAPTRRDPAEHKTVCRHGVGYTRMESSCRGIDSQVLYLVPPEEPLEIWDVTVQNPGDRERTIDVFGFCEWAFPYLAGELGLQATLYVAQTRYVPGVCGYQTPIPGWRLTNRFFATTAPEVASYDCNREAFVGIWQDESAPRAVVNGRCSNYTGVGGNSCGGLHVRVTLPAGAQQRFAFIVGEGEAETVGQAARQSWTSESVDAAYRAVREHWGERFDRLQVSTPDDDTNAMLNCWNAYQGHVCFRWSRSASLIEAGQRDGLGYRDTLQDTLCVMHTLPDQAADRIVSLLAGQASDGSALHKVDPINLVTGQGETPVEGDIYSDDHLWIPLALSAYCRETGDLGFLDREVDYLNEGSASVFDHAMAAIGFALNHRGQHGLLLSLAADWNDALRLNEGTNSGGQSVWTSIQFCWACRQLAELADATGRDETAGRLRTWADEMAERVNDVAWGGKWYLRGLMGDGSTIGAESNDVAKVWLNPQTWSVLAGVADADRGRAAMDAVGEHLASDYGLHLFAPPHTDLHADVPGRVQFPPGYKENAAIFCHPNPWAVMAETRLRRGETAYRYYRSLLPSAYNDQADLHHTEPYVYCQFVVGKWDKHHGTGHNPWLTGTAGWSYVAATQYILGIRPQLDGLEIDPVIPADWPGFSVTRVFRGATYEIEVTNPDRCGHGVRQLQIDGQAVEGNRVPPAEAGQTVKVRVTLSGE